MDTTPPLPSNPQNIQQNGGGIFAFLKKNYLIIFAVALILFFFYILFLSAISSGNNQGQITTNTSENNTEGRHPTRVILPTTTQAIKVPLGMYEQQQTWNPVLFSQIDTSGKKLTATTLSDGSTKYTYPSDDPNRPNELVVKNDTIVYHRTTVSQKYVYNYTNNLEAPDYTFEGSRYYGPNTITYLYLKRGTGFVADSKTTLVQEQFIFQPMTLEEFKQQYGSDVTSYEVIPTLPYHDHP